MPKNHRSHCANCDEPILFGYHCAVCAWELWLCRMCGNSTAGRDSNIITCCNACRQRLKRATAKFGNEVYPNDRPLFLPDERHADTPNDTPTVSQTAGRDSNITGLIFEQRKTNELLQQLISIQVRQEVHVHNYGTQQPTEQPIQQKQLSKPDIQSLDEIDIDIKRDTSTNSTQNFLNSAMHMNHSVSNPSIKKQEGISKINGSDVELEIPDFEDLEL